MALVVHIGTDNCHRVPVLESAGYEVDGCNSVTDLRQVLKRFELKAVLVSESEGAVHRDMIREVWEHCDAPLVLFRETLNRFAEAGDGQLFDMEIPVLQPPETWLPDLATLIACSQEIRARSREIRKHSQMLREETAALAEKTRLERQRSKEVMKKIPHPEGFVRGPEDDEES